jgi:hypothetical protein
MPVVRIGAAGRWTDSFESDPAVIYALDRDDRLAHCNRAWDRFALENNGAAAMRQSQLTHYIFDVIPTSLTTFYRELYESVRTTRKERTHIMECSSPLLLRRFHMSVNPFGESGLLIVDTLLEETPHIRESHEAESSYVDGNGIVMICSHCRRTQNVRQPERWDWVPEFLGSDMRVSHGLCPLCLNYHYGLTVH